MEPASEEFVIGSGSREFGLRVAKQLSLSLTGMATWRPIRLLRITKDRDVRSVREWMLRMQARAA